MEITISNAMHTRTQTGDRPRTQYAMRTDTGNVATGQSFAECLAAAFEAERIESKRKANYDTKRN